MTTISSNLPYIVLLTLKIVNSDDIVIARQRARQITALLNFDIQSQTRVATVVSEISRNACLYAGGGKVEYCLSKSVLHRTFMVRISDKGPGIPNISNIGSGLGIIGSKRIMDRFNINSSPNNGTEVIAEINLPKNTPPITSEMLSKISVELAKHRPPSASEEVQQQNQELLHALAMLSKARDDLEMRVQERTEQLQQEITERKRIEEWMHQHQEDLARVERMNSMGELASALAHELNQPLAAITTYTQGSIRHLKSEDYDIADVLKIMSLVAKESKRAGEIIHRMKNFVRQGELSKSKAEINQVIKEAVMLLQHEIEKNHVIIQFELSNALPFIFIDIIQIQQAVNNLIRNALQAMREVKTLNPTVIIKTTGENDGEIQVNIIDNGPGFKVKNPQTLLEPYFTTKKKGMGIGLSISRTIIEAHGGKLLAKKNPKGGAWFQFILPMKL